MIYSNLDSEKATFAKLWYKVSVTLSRFDRVTNDAVACMTLRKLEYGQRVVFCIPEEIGTKIREHKRFSNNTDIFVTDVLSWTISETYQQMGRNMPLWITQGRRFVRQELLWMEMYHDQVEDGTAHHARNFLEHDAQGLESRYWPSRLISVPAEHVGDHLDHTKNAAIMARCQNFKDSPFRTSMLQEEQERELSPEVQQERKTQRPARVDSAQHNLHPDAVAFVAHGVLSQASGACMPAFAALSDMSAAASFDVDQLAKDRTLLVTADFARTVMITDADHVSDAYQRCVHWVFTRTTPGGDAVDFAMIISLYEAQDLFPLLNRQTSVVLCSYKPRWNIRHRPTDWLNVFTIPELSDFRGLPPSLTIQLNLFADQLYFDSRNEYLRSCNFLGLTADAAYQD